MAFDVYSKSTLTLQGNLSAESFAFNTGSLLTVNSTFASIHGNVVLEGSNLEIISFSSLYINGNHSVIIIIS